MSVEDTTRLLEQIQSIDRPSLSDESTRVRILMAARALCQRLETPFEWVQRMTWQEVSWAHSDSEPLNQTTPETKMCSMQFYVYLAGGFFCCSLGACDCSNTYSDVAFASSYFLPFKPIPLHADIGYDT